MKATGIVRRIDDLGRIVIPKEIRRTQRIRESDPMEIYTSREGEIMLRKYSPIGELGQYAADYATSLAETTGFTACVTDRDISLLYAIMEVFFLCTSSSISATLSASQTRVAESSSSD